MKRAMLAILGVITIFSLCLAGTVSAVAAGYSVGNFQGSDITANGAVGAGEWTDSFGDWLYDGWTKTTSIINTKFEMTTGIMDQWKIEVLSDTTNDAGDAFMFSFCGAQDNAMTPQAADDVLVNYTRSATVIYRGTGTGWNPDPAIVLGSNVVVASSLAASAASATPHWIIELKFDKSGGIAGTSYNSHVRLAVYDATTKKTLMWPPMSQKDVPNSWGLCDYSTFAGQSIPEGLTVGVMLLLSAVAVIASSRYFRKPHKTQFYRPA